MDNTMTLEALSHREGLPTAEVSASERARVFMEGSDVALQAKRSGE